ncbi:hypothetical protein C0Q44_17740 [Paenibacillus sp. PCH8]|uniref:S-layer homology domain-containing protein n=1 Tax=Paenibacillus sp. PCH8 TaxID=2066524 RepID=UPI000CF8D87A|nr:S-layer homology domain-containing protein [Paenibacillus sp. PCH8]PQP81559.1 hypothetical protein C0Q44_17740 [Paenibacillus sp. PCH8]
MYKKRLHQLTIMLILVSFLTSMSVSMGMPQSVSAEEDTTLFAGGEGTLANPYKIASEANFKNITIPAPGTYFQQISNFQITGHWVPIRSFGGIYDGGNLTIEDLTIVSSEDSSSIGLFSTLSSGAVLENIRLENLNINFTGKNSFVGGLVGMINTGATVRNSSSNGSITLTDSNNVGGLTGYNSGSVINSSSTSTIDSNSNSFSAGNLVGTNGTNATISDSISSGTINSPDSTRAYLGGLVGTNAGTINMSSSSSRVTGGETSSVGGLIGFNATDAAVNDSYSTGQASSQASSVVGGLAGRNSGNINRSYSKGNASVGVQGMAGGLVGYKSNGNITNSYSSGNAIGYNATFVGGLIGMNDGGDVSYSYSIGSASGGNDANGGLIGYKQGNGIISDSYYNNDINSNSFGGVGKSATDLKKQATFAGWEFNTLWRVVEGYTYPSFQWQPFSPDEIIFMDHRDLTWDSIKGTNLAENEVTGDLILPITGAKGSTINWTVTGQTGLIDTSSGKVTRASDDDHAVILTAAVTHPGGQMLTKDFYLIVIEAPNNKPVRQKDVVSTTSATVTINSTYELDLSKIFEDADQDPLTYKVSINGAQAISAAKNYTYTPTSAGLVSLVFTASDGESDSDDTYTVNLTGNSIPVRQASVHETDEVLVTVNTPYTLDLATIFEDADSNVLNYKVSVNGANPIPADENFTYTATTAGLVTLIFTANDTNTDSTDTYTVNLTVNSVPVRNPNVNESAKVTVTLNTPYTLDLDAIFEDADRDTLTYKVSIDGAPAVAANSAYSYTPTAAGSMTFVFTANDGNMDSTDTYTIDMTVNTIPARKSDVDASTSATVTVNTPYTLNLATIFEDADRDTLTYKVSIDGAVAVAANSAYSYTATAAGSMTFVFTANDGNMDSTETYTVKLLVSTSATGGSGGNTGGSGSAGGSGTVTPIEASGAGATGTSSSYMVSIAGTELNIPVKIDEKSGRAVISLGSLAEKWFSSSNTIKLDLPLIPNMSSYTLELPAETLSNTKETGKIILTTQAGRIEIPSDMLKNMVGLKDKVASITIGIGNQTALNAETKAAIGNRPFVELSLALDGVQTPWNNPDTNVNISIPYVPTAEETNNPEHIVIWYIDDLGNITTIPSGRYDAKSGSVTFSTTHFSDYAVAYVKKNFSDLNSVEWARQSIEVLASKGIINGTVAGTYSPSAHITRADYLVLLMKTLNLTARVDQNFTDVKPSDYYYEALGVSKKLGLATGSGNNEFHPLERISRQDMMVLTARALEIAKQMKASGDLTILDSFSDEEDIAVYAKMNLATLVKEGLISGSGNKLNPQAQTTRAEAAVFLYRIYNQY